MTSTVQAKPYAKAVFEYANDHKIIQQWYDFLHLFASFYVSDDMSDLLTNPGLTQTQRCEIIGDLLKKFNFKLSDEMRSFINILADNKRLDIVPQIFDLYSFMKENLENTMVADVIVFERPSESQKDKLVAKLSKRFNRNVSVNIIEDKNLLGGMIIKAEDNIIDSSVRRSLEKMVSDLVA